ncbi:MAG TPA: hypothetical protein VHC48_13340, partial [Puia sp.]|nr:hypothetical protein [Puia sp.]
KMCKFMDMKKKIIKEKSWVSERGITYIISDEPARGTKDPYVAKKLEEANKLLRKVKTPLPK